MVLETFATGNTMFAVFLAPVFCVIVVFMYFYQKPKSTPKNSRRKKSGAAKRGSPARAAARAEASQQKAAEEERSQRQRAAAATPPPPPPSSPEDEEEDEENAAAGGDEADLVGVDDDDLTEAPEDKTAEVDNADGATDAAAPEPSAPTEEEEEAGTTDQPRPAQPEINPSTARRLRRKRVKQRADAAPPAELLPPPPPPVEQHVDLPAEVVYQLVCRYTLPAEQLHMCGFPHSSSFHRGKAYIYKGLSCSPRPARKTKLDAAAKEFVPRALASSDCDSGTHSSETGDDSSGSSSSEPDEQREVPDDVSEPESLHSSGSSDSERAAPPLLRPLCVRCTLPFAVTTDGYYSEDTERCVFHWGKLKSNAGVPPTFECCGGRPGGRGCQTAACHVWSGLLPGLNGPLKGFVRTRRRRSPPSDGNHGVYALDCEMCYTGQGLELARVSVVGLNGKKVYDALVKPERSIVDYNTRFSGITARQLDKATKTLKVVQSDLMGFISADTLLVGHGLENDLRALRMVHDAVVDTSVLFPHYLGLPYRRRLSQLTESCLGWAIQQDGASKGHDSLEDARACVQLLLLRLRTDLRLDD